MTASNISNAHSLQLGNQHRMCQLKPQRHYFRDDKMGENPLGTWKFSTSTYIQIIIQHTLLQSAHLCDN